MNAVDIFMTNEDIVADMLDSICADAERRANWIELDDSGLAEMLVENGDRFVNYYCMATPGNPYAVGETDTRLWRICQIVLMELKNGCDS